MPEGMTEQDRQWHKIYDRLPKRAKDAVKDAYNHVASKFFDHGFAACGDDRAEVLVAAITRYLMECNDGIYLGPDPEGYGDNSRSCDRCSAVLDESEYQEGNGLCSTCIDAGYGKPKCRCHNEIEHDEAGNTYSG